jgi:hypothetical protein
LHIIFAEQFLQYTGIAIGSCPILSTTDDVIKHIEFLNTLGLRGVIDLRDTFVGSFDFANLYPSVVQDDVVNKVNSMVDLAMKYMLASHNGSSSSRNGKAKDVFVSVPRYPSKDPATWSFESPTGVEADLVLNLAQIKAMFLYLMQNAYVQGGVDKTTMSVHVG